MWTIGGGGWIGPSPSFKGNEWSYKEIWTKLFFYEQCRANFYFRIHLKKKSKYPKSNISGFYQNRNFVKAAFLHNLLFWPKTPKSKNKGHPPCKFFDFEIPLSSKYSKTLILRITIFEKMGFFGQKVPQRQFFSPNQSLRVFRNIKKEFT